MRKALLLVELLFSLSLFGQDLSRLRERAEKSLALRADGNKAQAAQYIDAAGRSAFLDTSPFPMRDVHMRGFEFTDDPKVVIVLFDARVLLPEVGFIPRNGRERWVWDKKDWFLRIETGDLFAKNNNAPPPPKPLLFELATTRLDLGQHAQGDVIHQVLEFKSDRDVLSFVRAKEFRGLVTSLPIWTSPTTGRLEITLDTTLLSEDVDYHVDMEAVGDENQQVYASFEIVSKIQSALRIRQTPELVDPSQAGIVELQFENLTNKPFNFYNISFTNSSYQFATQIPPIVPAGATVKLGIKYPAQKEPEAAQVMFKLSEPVVGKKEFGFPLNIKLPEPAKLEYSRQQLEELIRANKR
jgi:hypothetical protein